MTARKYAVLQEQANKRWADQQRVKLVELEMARLHEIARGDHDVYVGVLGWLAGAMKAGGRAEITDLINAIAYADHSINGDPAELEDPADSDNWLPEVDEASDLVRDGDR